MPPKPRSAERRKHVTRPRPNTGCMQTYYHSITAHPDTLRARAWRPHGVPVRCTPTTTPAGRARGRPGDFFSRAPGNPCESLLEFCTDSESRPDFSELAPPYIHHTYIRSLCTPTRESHCGRLTFAGPSQILISTPVMLLLQAVIVYLPCIQRYSCAGVFSYSCKQAKCTRVRSTAVLDR